MKYRPDLQCDVRDLAYDFETLTGRLNMAIGHRCDRMPCIALFVAIDPDVRVIRTFAGANLDTTYQRHGGDEWRAIPPPK